MGVGVEDPKIIETLGPARPASWDEDVVHL